MNENIDNVMEKLKKMCDYPLKTKMREVYLTRDGIEWLEKLDAVRHEMDLDIEENTAKALEPLGKSFAERGIIRQGYVQHSKDNVEKSKEALLGLICDMYPEIRSIFSSFITHLSSKEISESMHAFNISLVMWDGLRRLDCIDEQCREWGDNYARYHPKDRKEICVEDRSDI